MNFLSRKNEKNLKTRLKSYFRLLFSRCDISHCISVQTVVLYPKTAEMFVFLIILIVLLGLVFLLLILPVQLEIDTIRNIYQARWLGIMKANAQVIQNELLLRFQIFFWKKEVNLLHLVQSKSKKTIQKKKKNRGKSKSFRKFLKKGKRILRSFDVKTFQLELDTDNFMMNSFLYPVFYFLSRRNKQMHINYKGDFVFRLFVENRPLRILWAIIF